MVGFALKAADELAKDGIEAEVVDLRTIRPMDWRNRRGERASKTNRLVTIEEGWGPMGVGAEIAAKTVEHAFDYLDAPPHASIRKTCRCPTPPISRRFRCRRWTRSSKRGQSGLLPMSERPSWRSGGCHCGAVRFEAKLPEPVGGADVHIARSARKPRFIHLIVPESRFRHRRRGSGFGLHVQLPAARPPVLRGLRDQELLPAALQPRRLERQCGAAWTTPRRSTSRRLRRPRVGSPRRQPRPPCRKEPA